MDVFIATAGQIHNQDFIFGHRGCHFGGLRQSVAGLQRRDNTFDARQIVKRLQGFFIGNGDAASHGLDGPLGIPAPLLRDGFDERGGKVLEFLLQLQV